MKSQESYISEIHSEEMSDIIGRPPPKILTIGTILITFIVAIFLLCSWFLHYPDVVSAPVFLTSIDSTMSVFAPANSKISKYLVKDGNFVKAGQNIAIIENSANTGDMALFKKFIYQIDSFFTTKNYCGKILLSQSLQVGLAKSIYDSVYRDFLMYSSLNHIEAKSYADSEKNKLYKNLLLELKRVIEESKNFIKVWEMKYLLISPISGKAYSLNGCNQKQSTLSEIPIYLIVPKVRDYAVVFDLPIFRSGKVKVGQKVLIKLQEFPFEEYGMIQGHVSTIVEAPINGVYFIKINLDKGLHSTLNKQFEARPKMIGTADIITRDRNILQRILGF